MDYNCNTCGSYITPEHGGLVCNTCGSESCIDDRCSPAEFVNGHSIVIPYCFKCNPKSRRKALWKEYVRNGITFLQDESKNDGILSGMYWTLHWAIERKMPKTFIDLLEHKIKVFRQTKKIER